MYLFLAVLGLHCCTGFALVAERGGYSLAVVCRPLVAVALWLQSMGSRHVGFFSSSGVCLVASTPWAQ